MSFSLHATGLLIAFVLPLVTAWLLRGKAIVWNMVFALWIFLVGFLDNRDVFENMTLYLACALAAIGLVYWGLQEQRRARINLGVAWVALNPLVFLFPPL